MLRRLPLYSLLLVLLAAVPAQAAATKPHKPTKPKVKATGRIGVRVKGSHSVDGKQLALTGRPLKISGRIVPYVPGQKVAVRIWRGHKLLKHVTVKPKPTKTKKTATFSVNYHPQKRGDVQIFAVHAKTPQQRALTAKTALSVLTPSASPGQRSPFVALIQQRLAAVGYATPQNGVYDEATGLAVQAFRKVNGMDRVTTLTPTIVNDLMRGVGGFKVRHPQHGRHIEANLGWQVLAEIDDGKVIRAYTTSSGKPSTPTVLGTFHVYLKTPGTNSEGMVDSNYFIRGYAIHGYFSVPTYPASHGCLRVPILDAAAIYSWVRIGDTIDVYY